MTQNQLQRKTSRGKRKKKNPQEKPEWGKDHLIHAKEQRLEQLLICR